VSDTPGGDPEGELPERRVTFSQIVGYNITAYRKAAGLTQEELGERLGWTATTVSAAERSWDGKRIRKFDADELPRIAGALGVPVIALLLPPADAGTAVRYLIDTEPGRPDITSLLPRLASAYGDDTAALSAYRRRLMALGASKYDPAAAEADAGHIVREAKLEADIVLARAESHAQQIAADAQELMEAAAERDAREVYAGRDADAAEGVDRVIADVRREAHEMLERARRAADDILTKARRQSEQITSDASARAWALERDAQGRHRQAMGTLVQSRDELERRVDDLRAFERLYRLRLEAFLERQLHDLRAAPPDSGVLPPLPEDGSDPASDESGP
jgi:transcriptional regulator with XRE-family HTH domain